MSKSKRVLGVKLSKAEHAVLQRMASGENVVDAVQAVKHSVSRDGARQAATRMLKRDRFIAVLERAGLTDDALASKYAQLMNHKKPVVVDKEVQMFDDGAVQLATVKTLTKVKRYMDDEANEDKNAEPLIVKMVKFEDNRVIVNKESDSK